MWVVTYSVVVSLNNDITYRIFLFLDVLAIFVILLSTCNMKILTLVVSLLNEFGCVVLRVIAFALKNISMVLIMSSPLFLVGRISSGSTPTLVGPSSTSCSLVTSSLSVPLSSESSSDSSSDEEGSSEVLDSSSSESFSSLPVVPSR